MNLTTGVPSSGKVIKKKKPFHNITGFISVTLILLNTLAGYAPLLVAGLVKWILPFKVVTVPCTWIITQVATNWLSINNLIYRYVLGVKVITTGETVFDKKGWYLVLSNHQSWIDIVVLQMIFNRRIPILKFFIKQELIKVPLMGFAWWALDFPFMKRYSSDFIKKNPHLKGKDIEITRKACEKFRTLPVSVMNFVEGTRFSEMKHKRQNSPYKHLLKPRAGGTGFVFSAMGDSIKKILNVTIVYPQGDRDFWNFLCGLIKEVDVHIETMDVTPDLVGDYENDPAYKAHFQKWINRLWENKDELLERMK
ncbi:MAG: acyltransferase [Spirochaetes bacterium]|nr:acyltransferase [Spirochaetota bacterium]